MKRKNEMGSVVKSVIKEHIILSAALAAAISGAVLTGILPPLVLERILNRLAAKEPLIFSMAAVYALLLIVSGLFDAAKESLITIFGQKVTHCLRSRLCEKLSALPASYYTKKDPGEIVSRFVNDADTIEALFTSGVISMAADICKVVSITAVIFVKSRGLGCLLLIVTPILFGITRAFQKRMLAAQIKNREAVGKVNGHIPETIQNIRMIHTFGKEQYMERRYDSFIEESYYYMEKTNFYDAVYSPIIITSGAVLTALMMTLSAGGGEMRMWFGMSVGTAVAVIQYVGKIFEPLEAIGMEIQNIQSAAAGMSRIREFLEETESVREQKTADLKNKEEAAAELHHVTFGYEKEKENLHDYSFKAKKGETVTLAGRTGAGKSTIFKLLLGLYEPWQGEVRIFGVPADQISDEQKRKLFGYVEQNFKMIPGTVRDQITLKDPLISDEDAVNAARMAGLDETIRALDAGYDTPCTPELFSQGQTQLLSIARAVAADPAILLLDEITANLDSETERNVLEALKTAAENRTVISISHRLYQEHKGRMVIVG